MAIKEEVKKELHEKRYAEEWRPWKSDWPRIRTVVELVGQNKKVLDLGCYEGTITQLIAQNQNEVLGVDFSGKALAITKERGIRIYRADIEKDELPFREKSFDVIVAAEVIEHVFDMRIVFEKIKKLLKPDGYLVLTTPNLATLGRRLLLLFGRSPYIEIVFEEGWGGHIRYFVKNTLFETLKLYGFKADVFTSDVVNLNWSGTLFSTWLAKIWPTLGKTLIVKASRIRERE